MVKFLIIMSPFIIAGVVFLCHYVSDNLRKSRSLYDEWCTTTCDFTASLDEMKTYYSVAPDKYVLKRVYMFRTVNGRMIRIKPNRDELGDYVAWRAQLAKENDARLIKEKMRSTTQAQLDFLQTVVSKDIDRQIEKADFMQDQARDEIFRIIDRSADDV